MSFEWHRYKIGEKVIYLIDWDPESLMLQIKSCANQLVSIDEKIIFHKSLKENLSHTLWETISIIEVSDLQQINDLIYHLASNG